MGPCVSFRPRSRRAWATSSRPTSGPGRPTWARPAPFWWLPRLTVSLVVNAIGARRDDRAGRTRRVEAVIGSAPRRAGRAWVSWLDVRLGVRMLGKFPGMSVASVIGIAVAVGMGLGFFNFMQAHFYPIIPLDEGHRLVGLENWDLERNNEFRRSLWDFTRWRDGMRTVEDMTAFSTVGRNLILDDGTVEPITVARMTPSGFDLARVPPLLGRRLVESDGAPGAPAVLVVGYDAWQARFGGDPDVLGTDVRLGATPHTIVGVMPPEFRFPVAHQYWVPLPEDGGVEPAAGPSVFIAGRLAPGADMEAAQAELTVLGARAAADQPDTHGAFRAQLMPYAYPILDINQKGAEGFLWEFVVMMAMGSLLLVVVCANVAILVYARTAARRGEIAVRTALGASRARILSQLAVEGAVLAGAGALLGLAIARIGMGFGIEIMKTEMGPALPFWMETGVSPAAAAYAAGLTAVAAVIIGVIPGLQATSPRVQRDLTRYAGRNTGGMGRTWNALIVVQMAVSAVALPGAMLLAWDEVESFSTVPTYEPERFLTGFVGLESEESEASDGELEGDGRALAPRYEALARALVARLEAEPGVEAVSLSLDPPIGGARERIAFDADTLGAPDRRVRVARVGPTTLEVLELPLLAGRGLEPADFEAAASRVVVVDRTFARRYGSAETDVLGRRIHFTPSGEVAEGAAPRYEIVGVVENLEENPLDPASLEASVYRPMGEIGPVYLTARVAPAAVSAVAGRIRASAVALDPTARVGVRSYDELERQNVLVVRLVGLGVLLCLASVLLLAAAGVYALMSFTVTQRRREIGVRTALGSPRGAVLRSVLVRSGGQIAAGLALGVAAFLVVDLLVLEGDTLLLGRGAVALVASVVLMAGTGLAAATGPARRGLSIQPAEVLKAE